MMYNYAMYVVEDLEHCFISANKGIYDFVIDDEAERAGSEEAAMHHDLGDAEPAEDLRTLAIKQAKEHRHDAFDLELSDNHPARIAEMCRVLVECAVELEAWAAKPRKDFLTSLVEDKPPSLPRWRLFAGTLRGWWPSQSGSPHSGSRHGAH